MRRSTLCLRSVHLPLRWLHPAEGSFLGTEEGRTCGLGGKDSGWVGLRDSREERADRFFRGDV